MPAIKSDLTWLQKHEKVILGIGLLLVVIWLGNKYLNVSADKADAKAAAAQQALDTIKQQNADFQKKVDEQEQQYQVLVGQLTAQNRSLLATIAGRNQAVQTQQKTDASLALPELAVRWKTLIPEADVQIVNTSVSVSESSARATVQQLELVPVLQANLGDEEKLVANKDQQIAGLTGLTSGLSTQVDGLKTELTAKDTSCKADIAKIKADDRRSKRNWFIKGAITAGTAVAYLLLHK